MNLRPSPAQSSSIEMITSSQSIHTSNKDILTLFDEKPTKYSMLINVTQFREHVIEIFLYNITSESKYFPDNGYCSISFFRTF